MFKSIQFANTVSFPRNAQLSAFWTVAIVFPAPGVHAEEGPDLMAASPMAAAGPTLTVPGTDYAFIAGVSQLSPASAAPAEELVTALSSWLASEFGFPRIAESPSVKFGSRYWMVALRHAEAVSGAAIDSSDTVAVYDDRDGTIFLPEGWTGRTPTELSVLVHELVHHLQNKAGQRFSCGAEREKVAY